MVYDQTSTGNCSLFTFFLSLHIGRGRCSNLHTQDLKERNKKHKKKISRVSKNFPLKIALYLFFIFGLCIQEGGGAATPINKTWRMKQETQGKITGVSNCWSATAQISSESQGLKASVTMIKAEENTEWGKWDARRKTNILKIFLFYFIYRVSMPWDPLLILSLQVLQWSTLNMWKLLPSTISS